MSHFQEFESFIGAYRENLLSTRQTAEKLVNSNDARSLKYVSKAYIERYNARFVFPITYEIVCPLPSPCHVSAPSVNARVTSLRTGRLVPTLPVRNETDVRVTKRTESRTTLYR